MTITPRLNDALAAARHAAAMQAAAERPAGPAAAAAGMAPVALTPLAPPRTDGAPGTQAQPGAARGGAAQTDAAQDDTLPGMVPTARRELFDRTREELLDLLGRRDLGALPPSWAGVSGRLTQEEAASAAAALQLIAARVSP